MRKHACLLVLLASPVVWAGGFAECKQDATSTSCSAYLNGVVDSALLLGDKQAKARFGETFSERALSSRAGERLKQFNNRYCGDRLPDQMQLRTNLMEHFAANRVDSVSDMYDILAVELSCYRSPRTAGTPSDVTP